MFAIGYLLDAFLLEALSLADDHGTKWRPPLGLVQTVRIPHYRAQPHVNGCYQAS